MREVFCKLGIISSVKAEGYRRGIWEWLSCAHGKDLQEIARDSSFRK